MKMTPHRQKLRTYVVSPGFCILSPCGSFVQKVETPFPYAQLVIPALAGIQRPVSTGHNSYMTRGRAFSIPAKAGMTTSIFVQSPLKGRGT
jgi:hypothetical protein